jgi:hypothetical protein
MGSWMSWRRGATPLLLAVALGLTSSVLAAAGEPAAQAATAPGPVSLDLPSGALVAPGKAADLEVLFTGDVIGYIEPCG